LQRIVLPAGVQTPWETNNRIPALLFKPAGRPSAGLVALHGYTGSKETLATEAEFLSSLGYAVIVPDLPLHGERALGGDGLFQYPFYGDPSGVVQAFENALADVRACADYLRDAVGPGVPLGITGFSLGGCLTILTMARMPGLFSAGVSVVGAARLAKLLLTSTICGDIRDDLLSMGYDQGQLEPVLRPVEATEYAANVQNLLMLGADDDRIVPGRLVRETFVEFDGVTNRLVMFNGCGHFPDMVDVARNALPFFADRFARVR
jgi:dienelactone hydrolase